MITFGLKPTRPETGFGYLELEKLTFSKVCNIVRFDRKPDKKISRKMIADGTIYGIQACLCLKQKT